MSTGKSGYGKVVEFAERLTIYRSSALAMVLMWIMTLISFMATIKTMPSVPIIASALVTSFYFTLFMSTDMLAEDKSKISFQAKFTIASISVVWLFFIMAFVFTGALIGGKLTFFFSVVYNAYFSIFCLIELFQPQYDKKKKTEAIAIE